MKVNVIFMRHGEGCHNAARALFDYDTVETYRYLDAELTPTGVAICEKNGKAIRPYMGKPDVVIASSMIRAIETAHYVLKGMDLHRKIILAPYLKELGENPFDNVSSLQHQKSWLRSEGIHPDFRFVEDLKDDLRSAQGDIPKFLDWLARVFLPLQWEERDLTILVVTHSALMERFMNTKAKFPNNFALEGTFVYSSRKRTLKTVLAFEPLQYPIHPVPPPTKSSFCSTRRRCAPLTKSPLCSGEISQSNNTQVEKGVWRDVAAKYKSMW